MAAQCRPNSYGRTCCCTRGHTSPDNGKRHTFHRCHPRQHITTRTPPPPGARHHVLTSPTATPSQDSGYNHHQNAPGSSSEHAHVSRPATTETKNARDASGHHAGPRSNFHTATAATARYCHTDGSTSQQEHRHGHNGSTRHHHDCRTSGHGHTPTTATTSTALIAAHMAKKKPPHGLFSCGGGVTFLYSVTIFTISSAVFPSGAFINFAFDKLRFISAIRVCMSSTILPIPLSILFSLSKTAKQ